MNKTLLFLALPVFLASCGSNGGDKTGAAEGQTDSPTTSTEITFGIYSDTLPCADCNGILTELIILPDTTYRLSERKIGPDGRPSGSGLDRGVYSFPADGKIKLTSRGQGNPERILEIGDRTFRFTDVQATANMNDLTLDLAEEVIGKKGGELVYYKTKPFNGHPTMVYSYVKGNDIHISKAYLDIAPEAEKAIVAYYAAQYNSGCEGNACALSEALKMDDAAMKTLVNKWMPTEALHERNADSHLALLFIVQNGDQFQVNYNVMDKDMMMMGASDVFKLVDNKFEISHQPLTARGQQKKLPNAQKPSGRNKQ